MDTQFACLANQRWFELKSNDLTSPHLNSTPLGLPSLCYQLEGASSHSYSSISLHLLCPDHVSHSWNSASYDRIWIFLGCYLHVNTSMHARGVISTSTPFLNTPFGCSMCKDIQFSHQTLPTKQKFPSNTQIQRMNDVNRTKYSNENGGHCFTRANEQLVEKSTFSVERT